MDPLSDVLRAIRLDGAYFFHVEAAAPWSVTAVAARELVPRIMPAAEHLISYHILLSGRCWGGPIGGEQILLEPGDVIVFPHGDPHLMSSEAGRRFGETGVTRPSSFPETVKLGPEHSRDTTLVCGFLGCDINPFNPLLASLPQCLHLRGVADGWMSQFPQQVVAETREGRAGSESMLTRMAELMFVEVLRRHIEHLPDQQNGWLAGLRDPLVGRALVQMHSKPADPWTLQTLARAVNSSRSVVAERFVDVVGLPPMMYLTKWRLQLAGEQLRRGTASLGNIAAQVGYASEAAFSRAFKRETGVSPGVWRKSPKSEI